MTSLTDSMISKFIKCLLFLSYLYVFEIANAQNIEDPVRFDSSGMQPSDVQFLLYTNSNRDSPQIIHIGDKNSLSNSNYDKYKPTKFMIHGWKENANADCVPPVRKGFLKYRFNVVVVEWKRIAESEPYEKAASKVQEIGKRVAKMVDFLIEQGTLESEITIAGHSLGGHIAGLAAHFSKNSIPHVVAMDPAKPGFTKHGKNGRVHVSDAELVETIHTDTQLLGFSKVIGRIDYFPNGGKFQPGCENSDPKVANFCAHKRACHFYSESLLYPDKWLARRCDDYESFKNGECRGNQIVEFASYSHKVSRPDGTYYLETSDKQKSGTYGLGRNGV